ncbi:TonB-dependent receptor [Aurantiacibacter xanthus]|nr:TonB-dependent receptor [Aurantiacibacter xanthus]
MTFKSRLLMTAALAAGYAACSAPALAQDETERPGQAAGNNTIVVTAQFREQSLQSTPLAITAISSEMLDARSQTSVAEIAGQAPSVTLKPQGTAFGPALGASIRGVGQFDFNPGFEPGVGLYVDDVYYATLTGSILDLLDLERVEVLRGPQGTLAGKNSIGGAIKLYSRQPKGDGSGFASVTYGSRNRLDFRGAYDLGIAENVAFRVSAVSKVQDGYVDRIDYGCAFPDSGIPALTTTEEGCVVDRNGQVNYQAVRGQLRIEATPDIEINISGDYTTDNRNSPAGVLTVADYQGAGFIDPYGSGAKYDSRFICGKFCNYAGFQSPAQAGPLGPLSPNGYEQSVSRDEVDLEAYGFAATIDWKLADNLALKSITAYRAYEAFFGNDDDYSPLAHSLGRSNIDFWSFSQELRLSGTLANGLLDYTVGGFYQDQKSVYLTFQDLRYAAPGFPPFIGTDTLPADTKAVFAQLTLNPTERLTLLAGIRYTEESKNTTYMRNRPDGTPHPLLGSLNDVTGSYSGDQVDYRLSAQYQITDEVMAYAQVSTGFKGGGVSPRPFAAAQVIDFAPETLDSYEIGLKSDLFDRIVRLNLTGFYMRYDDIQLNLLECPDISPALPRPCPITRNVGAANISGFEAEVFIRPGGGFQLDGALSHIDFDFRESAKARLASVGIPLSDTTPYNPDWKWSLGAQYEAALGNGSTLTPRIDASYQSDIYSRSPNTPSSKISAYTLVNARLSYFHAPGDWELALEVSNLLDKYYYVTSFDLLGAGGGIVAAQPGRPREWAVSLRKNF